MCPDNKIKSSPGNATHCDDDTACDGRSYIPNVGHTACGKLYKSCFEILQKDLYHLFIIV